MTVEFTPEITGVLESLGPLIERMAELARNDPNAHKAISRIAIVTCAALMRLDHESEEGDDE